MTEERDLELDDAKKIENKMIIEEETEEFEKENKQNEIEKSLFQNVIKFMSEIVNIFLPSEWMANLLETSSEDVFNLPKTVCIALLGTFMVIPPLHSVTFNSFFQYISQTLGTNSLKSCVIDIKDKKFKEPEPNSVKCGEGFVTLLNLNKLLQRLIPNLPSECLSSALHALTWTNQTHQSVLDLLRQGLLTIHHLLPTHCVEKSTGFSSSSTPSETKTIPIQVPFTFIASSIETSLFMFWKESSKIFNDIYHFLEIEQKKFNFIIIFVYYLIGMDQHTKKQNYVHYI
jgi:hypothetical protein